MSGEFMHYRSNSGALPWTETTNQMETMKTVYNAKTTTVLAMVFRSGQR